MISVTIVGGPDDGIEVAVDDGYDRVHMIEPVLVVETAQQWLALTEETGVSIHQIVMPVRRTPLGYRAYWSERAR